mgnify:CR=1 FL=1
MSDSNPIQMNNTKKSRCKKGTRRNPKTGNCEPIGSIKTRKNKNALNVEPVTTTIPSTEIVEENKEEVSIPKVITNNKTRRRCPKGTRLDKKTGLCNKTRKKEDKKIC